MSQNDAIPVLSRPPSSARTHRGNSPRAGSVEGEDSENNLSDENRETTRRPHDHSRPFPPPRLPTATASTPTGTGRTAPLTPLSSSFRSRTSAPRSSPQNTPETSPNNQRDVHNSRILPSNDNTPTPQQQTVLVQSPQTPRSPTIGEVSLTVPRPDGERTINEYVEAPFKHCCNQDNRRLDECPKIDRRGNNRHKGATINHHRHNHNHHRHNNHNNQIRGGHTGVHQSLRGGIIPGSTDTTSTTSNNVATSATAVAVTKQPVSFTKEPAGGGNVLGSPRSYLDGSGGLSIMCDFCGRCRCESCREPPPLPSRWLCDNSCYCSPETVLDYASCLCCAKGLFYHCTDHAGGGGIDSENGVVTGSCADEPCSCTGNKRASRWACLGALTLVLPCLLCYWPLKGCVAVCEFCYARHASQGCRCNPNTLATSRHHPDTLAGGDLGDSRDPEKRLLDPVTPEL